MRYTTPELEIHLIESHDVITASVEIETTDDGIDILAKADDILNQIFGK